MSSSYNFFLSMSDTTERIESAGKREPLEEEPPLPVLARGPELPFDVEEEMEETLELSLKGRTKF
jgi:hypothetical protein